MQSSADDVPMCILTRRQVLVDCFQRGGMWILAVGLPGLVVVFLELVVFAGTHASGGKAWKVGCFADAPWLIAAIMANGFRSPLGALAVAGLHFLPLWLWLFLRVPGRSSARFLCLGPVLLLGRCLAAAAELWVLRRYLGSILSRDATALSERQDASR
ncbi:PIS1 [Symbiodinium natans]|uniref:PIS1 protein n=1 Tax=Symbiodinium natans TaxID=878477 RepID=A0A812G2Z7_9DINO|nr:PIS1 [Symbiodinium natans]